MCIKNALKQLFVCTSCRVFTSVPRFYCTLNKSGHILELEPHVISIKVSEGEWEPNVDKG